MSIEKGVAEDSVSFDQDDGADPSPSCMVDSAEEPDCLERSWRAQIIGLLTTGIFHELNDLLTVALSSLDQLDRQSLDSKGREQLHRTRSSVLQAARVAWQSVYLAIGREAEPRLIDINEALRQLDRTIGQTVGYANGLIVQFALVSQALRVRLVPNMLELTILELLRNAFGATQGRGPVVVRTVARSVDGSGASVVVEVSVSDYDSRTMPEVARPLVSAPAIRVSRPRTDLSLSMVKHFVESCGGTVAVEITPEQDTTCRLTFPSDAACSDEVISAGSFDATDT